MIVAITSFALPRAITRDEARAIFLGTAPTYQGVPGLKSKHYLLSEDGAIAGGVYFWESKAHAEALFTDAWRAYVRAKYGTDASVRYFDSPVTVDNLARHITSGD